MKTRSAVVVTLLASGLCFAAGNTKEAGKLPKQIAGKWKLTGLSCNGVHQTLDPISYELTFNGDKGNYFVSTKAGCKQVEPETYTYPNDKLVTIKSGPRTCNPNPCDADVAAKDCGKGGTVAPVKFDVAFLNGGKTLTITTNDPNSIDCIGEGQSKPAVFTFAKE